MKQDETEPSRTLWLKKKRKETKLKIGLDRHLKYQVSLAKKKNNQRTFETRSLNSRELQ